MSNLYSAIVFDWDLTLFPTGSPMIARDMQILDNLVHKLLLKAYQNGDVYIITNATSSHVMDDCAKPWMPLVFDLIDQDKVTLISARTQFGGKDVPKSQWKYKAFNSLMSSLNNELVHEDDIASIISVGDSYDDVEIPKILQKEKFPKCWVKTVKVVRPTKVGQIIDQLSALYEYLNNLCDLKNNINLHSKTLQQFIELDQPDNEQSDNDSPIDLNLLDILDLQKAFTQQELEKIRQLSPTKV